MRLRHSLPSLAIFGNLFGGGVDVVELCVEPNQFSEIVLGGYADSDLNCHWLFFHALHINVMVLLAKAPIQLLTSAFFGTFFFLTLFFSFAPPDFAGQ